VQTTVQLIEELLGVFCDSSAFRANMLCSVL